MSSADSTFVGLILCDVSVERNGRFDSDEDREGIVALSRRARDATNSRYRFAAKGDAASRVSTGR